MEAAAFDVEAYNAEVRAWGQSTLAVLKSSLAPVGSRGLGTLMRSLRVRFYQRYGEIFGLGFQFARHGVFLEKGARKGYGGQKGSRWWKDSTMSVRKDGSIQKGGWMKTNPESLGKMNTGNSRAFQWFNPVVELRMEQLADLVAKHYGDMAINAVMIR